MHDSYARRARDLRDRVDEANLDLLLITDPVSVYFLAGYWGYVDIEFGRPTILCVSRSGDFTLITPKLEYEMAREMTWIDDVRTYADGVGGEWRDPLFEVIGALKQTKCGVEVAHTPSMVTEYLRGEIGAAGLADGSAILNAIRMVKSATEIELLRKAGQVAVAMGTAARDAIRAERPRVRSRLGHPGRRHPQGGRADGRRGIRSLRLAHDLQLAAAAIRALYEHAPSSGDHAADSQGRSGVHLLLRHRQLQALQARVRPPILPRIRVRGERSNLRRSRLPGNRRPSRPWVPG